MTDLTELHTKVSQILSAAGFEVHPFLVGWYNDSVLPCFALPHPPSTLAFIVISTPAMFERAFKPFICRANCDDPTRDLVDECMIHHLNLIKEAFPSQGVEILHDFELTPTRRPKILVQTAGHVSGAAHYYQRKDVQPDHWEAKQKICGVSIHPKYGGWFALRGVLIFPGIQHPHLPHRPPPDCVPDREGRIRLLEGFNFHWRDWVYRDIITPLDRYSQEQCQYFQTLPKDRKDIVEQIRANSALCGADQELMCGADQS